MANSTTILTEQSDTFNPETGEITSTKKYRVSKNKLQPTDEFIKVSKYINVIFAYNDIPLNLVPISLLLAQRMQFKTNIVYLLKSDKEEIAKMLDCSYERVRTLILDLKKYDIIRPTETRGKFMVNAFLFSTGDIVETRNLQAKFDFENDKYVTQADHKNLITGETVRKTVISKNKNVIPGQMSLNLEKNMKKEDAE